MSQSSQLFKFTFYALLIQFVIWLISMNVSFAQVVDSNEKYPCDKFYKNNTCLCEKSCMAVYTYNNKTSCKVKDCWKYKDDECLPNGKNFIAPLILNAVPFTSVLGIGYGVIERWDLFGIQLAVTFGPLILLCCVGCCCICCSKNETVNEIEDNSTIWIELYTKIYQCLYSILILTFWILSIVWVSTPQGTLDGNGCYLSGY